MATSRNQKLFDRLSELESQYRVGLKAELTKLVSGSTSMYFLRKFPGLFDGRFWRSDDTAQLESLEREIEAIRLKLGLATPGPLLSIVRRLEEKRGSVKDWDDGGKVRFAKDCLDELENAV